MGSKADLFDSPPFLLFLFSAPRHAPCQCHGSSCSPPVRLPAARPSPLQALLRAAAILSFLA